MTYLSYENEQLLAKAKQQFAESVVIFLRFGASRKIVREMLQHVIDIYEQQRRQDKKSPIILPEDFDI